MKQLSLLFLVKDDQILLAMKKRGFGAGLWNGVGGKQDRGETILQTAIRECQEEINVTPAEPSKVAELTFSDSSGEDMLVSVYSCHDWEGEPIETEEMKPKWFAINSLPYDQMWPDDSHWLPVVLSGQKLKGQFKFEDDRLIDWQMNIVEELV